MADDYFALADEAEEHGWRHVRGPQEWSGCDAGAAVQLWTIPDGIHVPQLTPAFAEALIRFLLDHPKQ